MSTRKRLIHANALLLEQGIEVLTALSDELFSSGTPAAFNASVGAHFRHCIDHYLTLRSGTQSGQINYEQRQRDARLESDRGYAVETACGLRDALAETADSELPALQVKLETCEGPGQDLCWVDTTLERELDYLINHTVHHYALIAVMLRLAGHETPKGFGVAPSTLRYLGTDAACAR